MTPLAIGIAHSGWSVERRGTIRKILAPLEATPHDPGTLTIHVSRSEVREHASVWAFRLWEWAARQDADVVLLNDDVELAPDFVESVRAMLKTADSSIVSLHTTLPVALSLAHAGQRFLRSYLVSGPGYVLRRGIAKELLRFVKRMNPKHVAHTNEDNFASYFMWSRREPAWATIPALVKHDTSVGSTLGYDDHPERVTQVPWDHEVFALAPPEEPEQLSNEDGAKTRNGMRRLATRHPMLIWPDFWRQPDEPTFSEVSWMPTESLAATEIAWLLGIDPGQCWACCEKRGEIGAPKTGLMLCPGCGLGLGGAAGQLLMDWRTRVSAALNDKKREAEHAMKSGRTPIRPDAAGRLVAPTPAPVPEDILTRRA